MASSDFLSGRNSIYSYVTDLRERERMRNIVGVCDSHLHLIFSQPDRWLSEVPASKKSHSSEGAPPFYSLLDSPITPRNELSRVSRKDEERWNDKRERKREREKRTGWWEAFILRFSGGWLPAFDGNTGKESLCDKLCNYGGGTSVAADLWIVQRVASTRPWHLSSA